MTPSSSNKSFYSLHRKGIFEMNQKDLNYLRGLFGSQIVPHCLLSDCWNENSYKIKVMSKY